MPSNPSESLAELPPAANQPQAGKGRPDPMILKMIRFAFQVGGRLAPAIAGRIAYKLWFMPTRHKTPASEKKAYETAEIQYVEIDGHNIVTYSWGKTAPTVLLVHGWSGRGTQLGSFVQPLIAAGFSVLSFDMPAHGNSSGKQTNLYEVAEMIVALQNHCGQFDAVITHSFGGPCIARAMQQGFETKRLVCISPPAHVLGLIEKFTQTLRIPKKAGEHLMQRVEDKFGQTIWEDISMANMVKELKTPGLLIHDTDDADIPWQEGRDIAQAWDKAKFIKTSGLGHRRILRDATVIASAVSFISYHNKAEA